eukprot:gene2511-3255_t
MAYTSGPNKDFCKFSDSQPMFFDRPHQDCAPACRSTIPPPARRCCRPADTARAFCVADQLASHSSLPLGAGKPPPPGGGDICTPDECNMFRGLHRLMVAGGGKKGQKLYEDKWKDCNCHLEMASPGLDIEKKVDDEVAN